jgi:hypothetical protein
MSMSNPLAFFCQLHLLAATLCLAACSQSPLQAPTGGMEALFTVVGDGHQTTVRALTQSASCPGVEWDGQSAKPMTVRVVPGTVAVRSDSGQKDSKEAAFNVLTCEAVWPAGAVSAKVQGQTVPAPRAEIRRVLIVGDTGCRMKASEDAFQPCNDPIAWPWAQVANSAAALKPDLVVHVGDIHYRESPCPTGNVGCANSPWGYGYDAWQADFFKPAKALLASAPWVFVRGNHESCFRAGQGWFRFVDAQPWTRERSCNSPEQDVDADYSEPYAVALGGQSQFLIFDSSKTSGKPFLATDAAFKKYQSQLLKVGQMAKPQGQNFFLSHHPLLAFAPTPNERSVKLGGNAGLQSVFGSLHPERLFPDGVSVVMHGHVHLFEAISFKSPHPVSLVMGNSGSANEGFAPASLPAGTQAYKGAEVDDYAAQSEYGFATLDRVGSATSTEWLLTEYSIHGVPMIRCKLMDSKSRCSRLAR